jgi:hypothetical protein
MPSPDVYHVTNDESVQARAARGARRSGAVKQQTSAWCAQQNQAATNQTI